MSPTTRGELAAFMANEFPELNVLVDNAGVQRDIDLTKGVDELLAGENEIRVNLEARRSSCPPCPIACLPAPRRRRGCRSPCASRSCQFLQAGSRVQRLTAFS
jgi:hypothetical protein